MKFRMSYRGRNHMRTRYFIAGVLVGILLLTVGIGRAHRLSGKPKTLQGKLALARAQVKHDRAELRTSGWLVLAPLNWEQASHRAWLRMDLRYVRQLEALLRPFPDWWMRQAMCVHRGEGAWNSATGNGFYGGMQFAYGTWLSNGGARFARFAHQASPLQQLTVAYWLWQRSGWAPWPTTAANCGLL